MRSRSPDRPRTGDRTTGSENDIDASCEPSCRTQLARGARVSLRGQSQALPANRSDSSYPAELSKKSWAVATCPAGKQLGFSSERVAHSRKVRSSRRVAVTLPASALSLSLAALSTRASDIFPASLHEAVVEEGGAALEPESSPDWGSTALEPESSPDWGSTALEPESSPDWGSAVREDEPALDSGCAELDVDPWLREGCGVKSLPQAPRSSMKTATVAPLRTEVDRLFLHPPTLEDWKTRPQDPLVCLHLSRLGLEFHVAGDIPTAPRVLVDLHRDHVATVDQLRRRQRGRLPRLTIIPSPRRGQRLAVITPVGIRSR